MKKFSVNVHYDYCVSVDVVAENEDKALELATDIAYDAPIEELKYCNYIDACITDVQD